MYLLITILVEHAGFAMLGSMLIDLIKKKTDKKGLMLIEYFSSKYLGPCEIT